MSHSNKPNPKLSRRLKRSLLTTLLAVLILATAAAALSAYFEASDIQDETLLSIASLVDTHQIGVAREAAFFDNDNVDDSQVLVWEIGRSSRHGFAFEKPLKQGFHTLYEDDDFWRVYVADNKRTEKKYAVAQKLSVSAEIAAQSAANTAIPLLLLFLLVPLLITLNVRHSFKPLNVLTDKIGKSGALKLDLANKHEIPVEVLPFVSAIDSLLEKNDAYNIRQRRFIADAAHELRTPITALSLEIENVQAAKSESVKHERQLALAQSVSRLQRLLNQLLDLARAQATHEAATESVSFNELVRTQVADLYLLAENKGIDIRVNRNEPLLVADSNRQLQHLVRNALSNALKYAPESGHVDIDLYQDHGDAVFRVVDNGHGVASEHLDKLREPFYRPDGQASGTGAGLGLAICHEIAMHLKGQLAFENMQPTGFKFQYRQPLA